MLQIRIKLNFFFFVSKLGRVILEMTLNIRIPAADLDLALFFGPSEHGHRGSAPSWKCPPSPLHSLHAPPQASVMTQHLWHHLKCYTVRGPRELLRNSEIHQPIQKIMLQVMSFYGNNEWWVISLKNNNKIGFSQTFDFLTLKKKKKTREAPCSFHKLLYSPGLHSLENELGLQPRLWPAGQHQPPVLGGGAG